MNNIVIPNQAVKMRITSDGTDVVFIVENRAYRVPYQVGFELSRRFTMAAKQAEEVAHSEELVTDSAILLRAGIPIGLTDNEKIKDEAVKEAVSSRELRRAMPGGVKSKEQFGKPTIVQSSPRSNLGVKGHGKG